MQIINPKTQMNSNQIMHPSSPKLYTTMRFYPSQFLLNLSKKQFEIMDRPSKVFEVSMLYLNQG